MNTWFTADWHFGHHNIIKYAERPFKDLNEMHKIIINNLREKVAPNDILYVLGDVAFYSNSQADKLKGLIQKIPGRKILILGNHDGLKPFTYIDLGFESVHTSLDIEDFILIHDPAAAIISPDRKHLCGHVHQLFKKVKNVLNVGIDVWDYQPVHISQVIESFDPLSQKHKTHKSAYANRFRYARLASTNTPEKFVIARKHGTGNDTEIIIDAMNETEKTIHMRNMSWPEQFWYLASFRKKGYIFTYY